MNTETVVTKMNRSDKDEHRNSFEDKHRSSSGEDEHRNISER